MTRFCNYLLLCFCLLTLFIQPVHGDIGPKPSVTITFKGLENQTYYATLLSEKERWGPYSIYDGTNARYEANDEYYNIWQAMISYQDKDGFYFLQELWECTNTHTLGWTYYPPETFKILIYLPDTQQFMMSDIYESYAFHSYFTMTIDDFNVLVSSQVVTSYDYTQEMISLFIRIILTILLELGIALFFQIKNKSDLHYIAIINIMTQIALNVALNIINFYHGQYAFIFYYFLLEILVILIESILYSKRFTKKKGIPYAICANTFSLGFGLWLAQILPGIF